MIICGLDPGKTSGGFAAIFSAESMRIAEARPMPDMQVLRGILVMLAADFEPVHVYIEKAQAMPKQGVVSMFTYGEHFGQLQGLLIGLQIPYTLVACSAWQRIMHAGCPGDSTKMRSAQAAAMLFPKTPLRPIGSRMSKPHSGMTEALLLAEYGRRVLLGVKANVA